MTFTCDLPRARHSQQSYPPHPRFDVRQQCVGGAALVVREVLVRGQRRQRDVQQLLLDVRARVRDALSRVLPGRSDERRDHLAALLRDLREAAPRGRLRVTGRVRRVLVQPAGRAGEVLAESRQLIVEVAHVITLPGLTRPRTSSPRHARPRRARARGHPVPTRSAAARGASPTGPDPAAPRTPRPPARSAPPTGPAPAAGRRPRPGPPASPLPRRRPPSCRISPGDPPTVRSWRPTTTCRAADHLRGAPRCPGASAVRPRFDRTDPPVPGRPRPDSTPTPCKLPCP